MRIYSKLKQHYKYLRNLKKLRSRQPKIRSSGQFVEQVDFYSRFIQPSNLVFDIGANIGDKTEIFLRLGAKVVAAEPQESCWRVLKRRFENDNVSIETVALADKEGTKTLFVDRSTTLSSTSQNWIEAVKQSGRFSSRHKWGYKIPVQATTLDALIEKYGKPAFCKIDVEGAEFETLQGLSQPIKTISLEFVTECINPTLGCIDYLTRLGRAEFNYCLGGSMSFALSNWVDCNKIKAELSTMDKEIDNYGDIYVRFVDG